MSSTRFILLRRAGWPVAICCVINFVLLTVTSVNKPDYLLDSELQENPDARQYLTLGHNFWQYGEYSRQRGTPYEPDLLRTPVFPLVAGGLDLLCGPWALFLLNILAHAGTCLAVFVLVDRLFAGRAANVAALLVATDLMLAVNNFQAMAESLFVFLMASSLALLIPGISGSERRTLDWRHLWCGGLLLGIATLTRPTSLYLPLVIVAFVVGRGIWTRRIRVSLMASAVIAISFALPVVPWVYRNYVVHDVPRMTNIDRNNLVYFVGAGAYQVHEGTSLEEAQKQIEEEFELPSYSTVQNPWVSELSPAEMDRQLGAAIPGVLGKYPKHLALASVLAIGKASVSHNVAEFAQLCDRRWAAPGIGRLVRLESEAFSRLQQNGPVLVGAFVWQLAHTAVVLILAAQGMLVCLVSPRRRPSGVVLFLALLYLYATVAMFGFEAFWRCRIPVVPVLCAFAGVGAGRLWTREKSIAIEAAETNRQ